MCSRKSISLTTSSSELRELCSRCQKQPFDLTCTCGQKYDFNCIRQHIEVINKELQEKHNQVAKKLNETSGLSDREGRDYDAAQKIIEEWVCIDFL